MPSEGGQRAHDHHRSPNPLTVQHWVPQTPVRPSPRQEQGQGPLQPSGVTQLSSQWAVPWPQASLPALPGAHATGRACWAFTWQESMHAGEGEHCQGRPAPGGCCAPGTRTQRPGTAKENGSLGPHTYTLHPAGPSALPVSHHSAGRTWGACHLCPSPGHQGSPGQGHPPLSHAGCQGKLTSRFVLALRSTLWVLVTVRERDGVSEIPAPWSHPRHRGTRPA